MFVLTNYELYFYPLWIFATVGFLYCTPPVPGLILLDFRHFPNLVKIQFKVFIRKSLKPSILQTYSNVFKAAFIATLSVTTKLK